MILQQMVNMDDINAQQQPTAIIKRVKKRKPTAIVLEDSLSDSSSDSLPIDDPAITVEDMPIQRPKRTKVLNQQKFSNITLKSTVIKMNNNILK